MAKVNKVSVSKGRTVNIGNYNSVRFEYAVEATMAEKDKPEEVKEWLNEMVEAWLDKEHEAWKQGQ